MVLFKKNISVYCWCIFAKYFSSLLLSSLLRIYFLFAFVIFSCYSLFLSFVFVSYFLFCLVSLSSLFTVCFYFFLFFICRITIYLNYSQSYLLSPSIWLLFVDFPLLTVFVYFCVSQQNWQNKSAAISFGLKLFIQAEPMKIKFRNLHV